jgi:hypothetical protein
MHDLGKIRRAILQAMLHKLGEKGAERRPFTARDAAEELPQVIKAMLKNYPMLVSSLVGSRVSRSAWNFWNR